MYRARNRRKLQEVVFFTGSESAGVVPSRNFPQNTDMPRENPDALLRGYRAASAARTAWMNAAILTGSLMPGEDSMPLATSTAHGRTA